MTVTAIPDTTNNHHDIEALCAKPSRYLLMAMYDRGIETANEDKRSSM